MHSPGDANKINKLKHNKHVGIRGHDVIPSFSSSFIYSPWLSYGNTH
jgi:hypothetical protein